MVTDLGFYSFDESKSITLLGEDLKSSLGWIKKIISTFRENLGILLFV